MTDSTPPAPDHPLWGEQTRLAVANFPISGVPVPGELVRALATVKAAAARTNADLGVVPADRAERIAAAAEAVAAGEHADQFPVDVFQTGSGTSTNMNVNEVIATLASTPDDPVHPNDDVNAGQSSNDTFPTAIHVAASLAVTDALLPALGQLEQSLRAKAEEYADAVKAGRTHLMDATPVTLGQELGGHASAMAYAAERLGSVLPRVRELPLGGTAVGTGLNAAPGFVAGVLARLAQATGQPFTEARDHFEAQGSRDSLVELSGVLRTVAVGLTKLANDLRWLASGPRTGLAEIRLPELQKGSSIMPGKVNPVLPEATAMVAARVVGNDATVAWAGASGNLELNVMMPVLAHDLLESVRLLARVAPLLAHRCVDGLTADTERMQRLAESSPAIVTPLALLVGYDRAAEVARRAVADGSTIRAAALALGLVDGGEVTAEQLDAALDVRRMTGRD